LDCPNSKEFADNNENDDKIGTYSSGWEEIIVGKGEIAHIEQFLLFRQ